FPCLSPPQTPRYFLCHSATGMEQKCASAPRSRIGDGNRFNLFVLTILNSKCRLKLFSMRDKCGNVGRIKSFDLVEDYFWHCPSGQSFLATSLPSVSSTSFRFCFFFAVKIAQQSSIPLKRTHIDNEKPATA